MLCLLNMESMNLRIMDSLSAHRLNLNSGFSELKLVLQDTVQSLRVLVDQKLNLLKMRNDIIHQYMALKLKVTARGGRIELYFVCVRQLKQLIFDRHEEDYFNVKTVVALDKKAIKAALVAGDQIDGFCLTEPEETFTFKAED